MIPLSKEHSITLSCHNLSLDLHIPFVDKGCLYKILIIWVRYYTYIRCVENVDWEIESSRTIEGNLTSQILVKLTDTSFLDTSYPVFIKPRFMRSSEQELEARHVSDFMGKGSSSLDS